MRAGVATVDIAPPLGLPMAGFVRRQEGATCHGLRSRRACSCWSRHDRRVVLCSVDTIGVPVAEADALRPSSPS